MIRQMFFLFLKLGVLESVLQAFMTTMDMSLFIMATNKNVARKKDFLAAWLLIWALMRRKLGFLQIRKTCIAVIGSLQSESTFQMKKNLLIKIFFVIAFFPMVLPRLQWDKNSTCSLSNVLHLAYLLIAADTDSSTGTRSYARDGVPGPFGIKYCNNKAGQELYECCATVGLCSATTFFQKPQYQTRMNLLSKLGHQIDSFIVREVDFARIRDAGRFGGLCVAVSYTHLTLPTKA